MNNNTFEEKYKVCNGCKNTFPMSSEYFNRNKRTKDGLLNYCKTCTKKKFKEYREKNRNELNIKQKQYKQKNKEKILVNEREYRIKNKNAIAERKKIFRQNNKEKIQKYNIQYRKENRESRNILKQKRRSIQKQLFSFYTNEMWHECKKHFNNECAYCGKKGKLTQEHFIPVSKGGEYIKSNIIPACSFCNSSKHDRDFFEWFPNQTFYSKQREQLILKYVGYKNNGQQLAFL